MIIDIGLSGEPESETRISSLEAVVEHYDAGRAMVIRLSGQDITELVQWYSAGLPGNELPGCLKYRFGAEISSEDNVYLVIGGKGVSDNSLEELASNPNSHNVLGGFELFNSHLTAKRYASGDPLILSVSKRYGDSEVLLSPEYVGDMLDYALREASLAGSFARAKALLVSEPAIIRAPNDLVSYVIAVQPLSNLAEGRVQEEICSIGAYSVIVADGDLPLYNGISGQFPKELLFNKFFKKKIESDISEIQGTDIVGFNLSNIKKIALENRDGQALPYKIYAVAAVFYSSSQAQPKV